MHRARKTFTQKLDEASRMKWLVDLGLIDTATILFPDRASHYTDAYLDHMAKYWSH